MSKKLSLPYSAFLIFVVVIIGLAFFIQNEHDNSRQPNNPLNYNSAHDEQTSPNIQPITDPSGVPAIKPLSGVFPSNAPAFGKNEIQDFFNANNQIAHRMTSKSVPSVIKIEFAMSQFLQAKLPDTSIGVSKDILLCYVELQGTYTVVSPFGPSITYSHVFAIFNAHTGNLLLSGGIS